MNHNENEETQQAWFNNHVAVNADTLTYMTVKTFADQHWLDLDKAIQFAAEQDLIADQLRNRLTDEIERYANEGRLEP